MTKEISKRPNRIPSVYIYKVVPSQDSVIRPSVTSLPMSWVPLSCRFPKLSMPTIRPVDQRQKKHRLQNKSYKYYQPSSLFNPPCPPSYSPPYYAAPAPVTATTVTVPFGW